MGIFSKSEKYIKTNIGLSHNIDDPYLAALEAAKNAKKKKFKENTNFIIYTNPKLDQKLILKGLNEELGKENWFGFTTDKIFSSETGYDEDLAILVFAISSKYIKFNTEVCQNYLKEPQKKGALTIKKAINNLKFDHELDAYIQFTRVKNKKFESLIRTPPYLILTFMSGVQIKKEKTISGREEEFLSGILDFTGNKIPIFGGSASSDLDDYVNQKESINYIFANGKIYQDSALVVFVVCDLEFTTTIRHGYSLSKDFLVATKVSKDGREILELNGKDPINEYAKVLKTTKKELIKNPGLAYSKPLGLLLEDNMSYIKEAVPDEKTNSLKLNFKIYENSLLNVLKLNKEKTLNTSKELIEETLKKTNKNPAFAMFCSCSGRRLLGDNIEMEDYRNLKKSKLFMPFVEFYSFGEIGAYDKQTPRVHSQTVSSLVIFDSLLTD